MKSRFAASLDLLAVSILSAGFWNPNAARAADTYVPFEGETTPWHDGFDRYDYLMDEESFAIMPFKRPDTEKFAVGKPPTGQRRCIVVVPKQPVPGNPWSWQACYWHHEPQTEVELLRRGFRIAFITPDPGKQWDAWYAWLTEKHGLSQKPAFVGMSKGGVNEYAWAIENPDKVACIVGRNPALRSLMSKTSPLENLSPLAKAGVPLVHVCDQTDPWFNDQTKVVEQGYKELGGQIVVIINQNDARYPIAAADQTRVVDFIVGKTK